MIHYYKVACLRDNLKLIREFVNAVLKGLSLTEVEINQLVLAVDEVCSNLIIHSQECNPNTFIEINIQENQNQLVFEIVDRNPQHFDISTYQNPNLNKIVKERKKGGLGLLLVHSIMDKVEVKSENSRSTWRLVKRI